MLNSIRHIMIRAFSFGSAICMAAVFLIVFINSVRRYSLGKSFEWGEELPIYLAVYGVIFGIALAYLQDRHVRLTLITDHISEKIRTILFVVVDAIVIASGVLVSWSGYLFAAKRGEVEASGLVGSAKAIAATTGMPFLENFGLMAPYQASMVFGGIFLVASALFKFVERINRLRTFEQGGP